MQAVHNGTAAFAIIAGHSIDSATIGHLAGVVGVGIGHLIGAQEIVGDGKAPTGIDPTAERLGPAALVVGHSIVRKEALAHAIMLHCVPPVSRLAVDAAAIALAVVGCLLAVAAHDIGLHGRIAAVDAAAATVTFGAHLIVLHPISNGCAAISQREAAAVNRAGAAAVGLYDVVLNGAVRLDVEAAAIDGIDLGASIGAHFVVDYCGSVAGIEAAAIKQIHIVGAVVRNHVADHLTAGSGIEADTAHGVVSVGCSESIVSNQIIGQQPAANGGNAQTVNVTVSI